jgi:hypothetical protein
MITGQSTTLVKQAKRKFFTSDVNTTSSMAKLAKPFIELKSLKPLGLLKDSNNKFVTSVEKSLRAKLYEHFSDSIPAKDKVIPNIRLTLPTNC